ncbi:uncharacterized protein N7446_001190 [Penicillium canescens]|uniref:alcohol dehydrogenase n=1 Tax=Penicillium canescens TaxID=5083 RepID=A0AAD6IBL5_PENCN|nr:uncharacterized protein N7446_001190 [Penicillium canescens]KAJ6042994.1 hypothetical protein N7460_004349 [Penicillium canescens]KAJ6054467.1 hypothetical protein N7444_003565 [Penicillium canescens]KAJ6073413.1 hypothetical protein N7446_001190 [Penicillium canescens]
MDFAYGLVLPLIPEGKAKDTNFLTLELDSRVQSDHGSCQESKSSLSPMMAVPATQRAVVTREVGKTLNMSLETISVREPGPSEVVIRISYSGICCSDSMFSVGPQPGYPKYNHIAGHEGIGHIVKSHEPTLAPSTNRLYGIRYLAWSCGSCTYCLHDLPTSCPSQLNTPKQVPGTFQEYLTVPSCVLVPLPENITDGRVDTALYAAALCSGSTALTSLRAASLGAGSIVVVVGVMGAIGHLVGMIAKKILGAKVIGVDLPAKVDRASPQDSHDYCDILLGAPKSHQGNAWEEFHAAVLNACAQLRGEQRGGGVKRAAECVIVTSSSIEAFQKLDEYVRDGGTIVCAGVPKGLNRVSLPLHCLVERNLHLSGNLMGSHDAALEVMEYIRTNRITPRVSKVRLEGVPERLQAMMDYQTVGKVVVCM